MFNELPHNLYLISNYNEIMDQVEGFEIIQKAGEVIFIPSGYMHQVINMEDTISINQNWFNGCNIDLIYANLIKAYKEVQDEIIDLKEADEDWFGTCQKLLAVHFGMDLKNFIEIIRHIANRIIKNKIGNFEFRFRTDVDSIKRTLSNIITDENFKNLLHQNDFNSLKELKLL